MMPQNYVTYMMARPLGPEYWRPASCDEIDCCPYLNGWVTRVDESTDLGRVQAAYIRKDRTRSHRETRSRDGLTEFTFPAGQRCYAASKHRTAVERYPLFAVKGGGNPMRIHKRPEDWVEDFSIHQDKLKTLIDKG